MDNIELLAKIYDENCNHSRHHENLRATMTNLIILVATGLLGLITFDQKLTLGDFPLALFLGLLGIFGALFSAKHYERLRLHRGRARAILGTLDQHCPDTKLKALLTQADQNNQSEFPLMSQWKLNHFWTLLHLTIALIGFGVCCAIIAGWPGSY